MPFGTEDFVHVDPVQPEDGYASLAIGILVGLNNDLQSATPRIRKAAATCVQGGGYEGWLDLLDLDPEARGRVVALLYQLATDGA
jgi:hypothetical protein